MRILIVLALCLCGGAEDWSTLKFLMGDWAGSGAGQPGQGSGGSSFAPDLQGRIVVRKNWADYPATKDRPAFRHDDLMIIYRESGAMAADYFDNEGHVIHYAVRVDAPEQAVFISEGSGPRYRLTYTGAAANRLKLKFEIAPPGKEFAAYTNAELERKR